MNVLKSSLLVLGLLIGVALAGTADPVVSSVNKVLDVYQKGAEKTGAKLRVVYFTPAGVEPQADYQARLTRVMLDIKGFHDSEMKRIGFSKAVLPLEMVGGELVIHMVKGAGNAGDYTHKSGGKVKGEVAKSLAGKINLDREFVLIFNGMCEKTGDLSYRFYAPYYGDARSNHKRGLCHVADCELQDPGLLKDTKNRIHYDEHYGDYTQSVADFNTKYLGGVAHELGHGLSLPHNGETRTEKVSLGTALMGSGNHTYRREVRGGKGSFLTLASAVRLAAHPLFTQTDRGRDAKVAAGVADLKFEADGKTLKISGKLTADPPAHAVIAYLDPDGRGDYDALTTVALPTEGGVSLSVPCRKSGKHEIRLVVCHANGAVTRVFKAGFEVAKDGRPDAGELRRKAAARE